MLALRSSKNVICRSTIRVIQILNPADPQRRNVTTSMVGLTKRSRTQKAHPKMVNPRDLAGECKRGIRRIQLSRWICLCICLTPAYQTQKVKEKKKRSTMKWNSLSIHISTCSCLWRSRQIPHSFCNHTSFYQCATRLHKNKNKKGHWVLCGSPAFCIYLISLVIHPKNRRSAFGRQKTGTWLFDSPSMFSLWVVFDPWHSFRNILWHSFIAYYV